MPLPTDDELERFRRIGDPLADDLVEQFLRRLGGYPADVIAATRDLAEAGDRTAENFWKQVHDVPAWVDFDAMEPAFEVALRNVIPSGLALMAGSLVESYASGRGAKVLVATGRLRTDTVARLFETAKYASDLALFRGARPGNQAWRNVIAVRLMHARVRKWIAASPDWRTDLWGVPVNQEDYAGTLFMFSLVYRRSLERIGVELTGAEHAGGHANWRWVGRLMGIDDRLLTASRDEEFALYGRIRRRNFDPDDDSRALAHGLLAAMSGKPPFFLPQAALFALSRRMVGDELAEAMHFPRSKVWDRVIEGGNFAGMVSSRASALGGRWSVSLGERLTRTIVDLGMPDHPAF